jgi:hypothetical protein
MDDETADDFWAATSLGPLTTERFGRRMSAYAPSAGTPGPWSQPGRAIPLPRPALGENRRYSERVFGDSPLAAEDIGGLLSSLAADKSGRRRYGAGGGLYVVGATLLAFRVAGQLGGRVWQHDSLHHTLTDVGPCPSWTDEQASIIPGDDPSPPPAVVLLFANPSGIRAKYGPRGDRFALLEAGAALQELGLASASLGLVGYALGGAWDERMRSIARLPRSARFVVAYAVGKGA